MFFLRTSQTTKRVSLLLGLMAFIGFGGIAQGFTESKITADNLISLAWSDGTLFAITVEGGLVSSENLGESFTEIEPADPSEFELRAVAATGDTLVAVGVDGLIYRSGDAGDTWTTITTTASLGDLQAIAPGPMVGGEQSWIAGGADGFDVILSRSVDDGLTWSTVLEEGDGEITGVTYDATAERWLAVGIDFGEGISFTSTDGGATWNTADVPEGTPGLQAVASDGEGNFIAVGDEGTILKWESNEWVEAFPGEDPVFETYYTVVSTGTNSWVAAGDDSVVATFDSSSISITEVEAGSGTIKTLLYLPEPDDLLLQGGEELTEADDPGPPTPPDMTTAVLRIAKDGNGDLLLTLDIPEADAGNTFLLESSTNLLDWAEAPGTELVINDFPFTWPAIAINSSEPRRFWRALWVAEP